MNIKDYATKNGMTFAEVRKVTSVHHMKKLTDEEIAALDAYYALDEDVQNEILEASKVEEEVIEEVIEEVTEPVDPIAVLVETVDDKLIGLEDIGAEVIDDELPEEVEPDFEKPEWCTDQQWKVFYTGVWKMKAIAGDNYIEE